MYDVITKQVAAQPYVSRTERVLVPELDAFLSTTLEELGESNGRPFTLFHGPVNHEEDGRESGRLFRGRAPNKSSRLLRSMLQVVRNSNGSF